MSEQKVTVGRAVHFVPQDDGPCRAATITEVRGDDYVDLEIHHAAEMKWRNGVRYHPQHKQGTWHWPERV